MYPALHMQSDDSQQTITVPSDLLEQVDEQLNPEFRDREEFVAIALRHYLAHYDADNSTTIHPRTQKLYEDIA